jgi:hypothetical protein
MAHPLPAGTQHQTRQATRRPRRPWADPAPVREHVAALLEAGTFQAVSDAAQVGQMTVWEIAHGARPAIKHDTAQALLAVQPGHLQPRRVDANGPMWRLRSLVAMGHTTGRIARALGAPRHLIEPLIRGERATIPTPLRDDVRRLWDAWWDKRPPRRTPAQKAAACKAWQRAAVHNWPCPAALDEDELDLPGYQPAARWRYATGTGTATDDPLGKTATSRTPSACRPASRNQTRTWPARQKPRPCPKPGA